MAQNQCYQPCDSSPNSPNEPLDFLRSVNFISIKALNFLQETIVEYSAVLIVFAHLYHYQKIISKHQLMTSERSTDYVEFWAKRANT